MPYKPKDGRPVAPDAPPKDIPATDRRMLRGTNVRPPNMPPSIGPTWKARGGYTMSGNVPGAEMIPMDLSRLLALLPLRRNELALKGARSERRDLVDYEDRQIESDPSFIPYGPLRGLRSAAGK